mmetsp:Transcript_7900/g.18130  ORF Transcript_7900/g.18130 Transcript_7900/m.18130 type:complete len:271 (+) Transcript_7900:83-895(+)
MSSRRSKTAVNDPEICEIRIKLAEVEAELKRYGPHGGWPLSMHDAFLRIFRIFKMQATPAFYATVIRSLPEITEGDLAEHVRCFAEQESRQAAKRRLLARWRERRTELEREVGKELHAEEAEQQRRTEERRRQRLEEQRIRVAEWRRARAEEEERRSTSRDEGRRHSAGSHHHIRARQQEPERERTQATFHRDRPSQSPARWRLARSNLELQQMKLQGPTTPLGNPGFSNLAASRLHSTSESFVQKIRGAVAGGEHWDRAWGLLAVPQVS